MTGRQIRKSLRHPQSLRHRRLAAAETDCRNLKRFDLDRRDTQTLPFELEALALRDQVFEELFKHSGGDSRDSIRTAAVCWRRFLKRSKKVNVTVSPSSLQTLLVSVVKIEQRLMPRLAAPAVMTRT